MHGRTGSGWGDRQPRPHTRRKSGNSTVLESANPRLPGSFRSAAPRYVAPDRALPRGNRLASPLGRTPQAPWELPLSTRLAFFPHAKFRALRRLELLARRLGLSRDGTRAPSQVRTGGGVKRRLPVTPGDHLRTPVFCPTDGVHLTHVLAAQGLRVLDAPRYGLESD